MNSKIKLTILGFLISFSFISCEDFLEPYPNGDISDDFLWEKHELVQGLVTECYSMLPRNYNNNEGAYLDGATDDAVITRTTHDLHNLAIGSLVTGDDPFQTYWERNYRGIRQCNTFLEDNNGYNTRFIKSDHWNDMVRNRLQGEAYALRAWFQWDLLQKFGGKGYNGELLGFPILTEPLDISTDVDLERNTYEECVRQIIADCDSAFKYLPIAHRDFLVEDPADQAYAGSRYWGRMDGITTKAIKALVYLTWASPRFNPDNDITRWDNAARYAKEVMDFKMNVDGTVSGGFDPSEGVNWFDPNFPGIVWAGYYQNNNDAMERMFYPAGFQGNGELGATQELVDAFPMSNGYPKDHPEGAALYDAENPYANRDNRFYSNIFYNGATANRGGDGEVMYTFENWGKDAAGANANNSRTNYHVRKFVYMGLNWGDQSIDKQPHSKHHIRWAHMVLSFAEAANQVAGPVDAGTYGMSAKEAIGMLRARRTYSGDNGLSSDPYLDEIAGSGPSAFNEFIKTERRIETAFEGMRYYDLRRWSTDVEPLNESVHRVLVNQNDDGSFSYDFSDVVDNRNFSSLANPIPYAEMLRMDKLVQNEGWDSWR